MSIDARIRTQSQTHAATVAPRIPRPPVAVLEDEAERPDIATQLEGAARLGHSLEAISVAASASPILQRQEAPEEEEEEPELQRELDTVQRQEAPEEEKEEPELQREPDAVQRQEKPEEEEDKEALQMQRDDQRVGLEGGKVPQTVESAINRARGGGQSLDETVQAQMSQSLGHDFSTVRVHTDAVADALNRQLSAKAFTTGRDIFFREGEYSPGSGSGRDLLGHELAHIVQQSSGRVSGNGGGMTARPSGDAFEQEADTVARKEVAGDRASPFAARARPAQGVSVIQRGPLSGYGRKHGWYESRWPGIRVDNSTIPGCTIWLPSSGSYSQLVISSHGGDPYDMRIKPLMVTSNWRVQYYAHDGSPTSRQLVDISKQPEGEMVNRGTQIRNYGLTKYQYSGGGKETYDDECRFVSEGHGVWAVLTVNKGTLISYRDLLGKIPAGKTIHALHCRGPLQYTKGKTESLEVQKPFKYA